MRHILLFFLSVPLPLEMRFSRLDLVRGLVTIRMNGGEGGGIFSVHVGWRNECGRGGVFFCLLVFFFLCASGFCVNNGSNGMLLATRMSSTTHDSESETRFTCKDTFPANATVHTGGT